jgi:tetratricopeptide (TPR) repeat protein
VYYNGNDAFQTGVEKINTNYTDNYSLILPIFKYSSNEAVRDAFGDMNRAIEKGSKCIRKHSIRVKPKRKEGKNASEKQKAFYEQKEFVKWIDDSYLLIGKADFYKHDFYAAIETFNYIIREYSTKPIKFDAYLWLSRTYIEMGKFETALEFLSKFEIEKFQMPEELIGPVALTNADLQIKQKQYETAIPFLITAIANTKKKKERVRYQYILGQLYQHTGEKNKAFLAYGKVIDMNPNYEMTFNARINRASIFNAAAADSKPLQKELNKMLKDDKNTDYRDQIYFALGNIAYNESRDNDAIQYFLESAHASTKNVNQKAMSYLAAADIYFERPEYRDAQAFYDSAVAIISPTYPDYGTIKAKSQNLNQLVENLLIIEVQDSLQKVASMPENERNQFIDQMIADIIEQEKKEKELLAQQQQEMAFLQQQSNETQTSQSSSWYFYNSSMLSMGLQEFKKKWGNRKLEDNWRRKNKTVVDFSDMSADNESTGTDSTKVNLSTKSREYYMIELPLTDSALMVSKQKVEQAYYNMAGIYKDKFNDFGLSIDGYLNLLKNYPQTEYQLASYYNLYKLYFLTKNYAQAELYKNKVIDEYPESEYAKVLSNPNYFKELEKIDNQVKFMYQATYKYFINNNCDEVQYNYRYVDSAYHESTLLSKFALLSTLCIGHTGDTLRLKDSLNAFIATFPKAEEVSYANEVLAALDRETRKVILEEPEEVFGGELAGDTEIDSTDLAIYTYAPEQAHYYIIVVANAKVNANLVQFNVRNFNIDYFSYLNFEAENQLLSADYSVVMVKPFKNRSMASNYFESVHIGGEVLNELEDDTYRDFIISESNYKAFIEDKNLLKYQKFFDIHYLKK